MINKQKDYFPALTGLRFVAASMVFLHHNEYKEKSGVLFNITNELHIGVTIFFVLSGFLITYRYYEQKKLNIKQFFVNRFARIYPVYFVLTTVTFIIMFFQKIKVSFLILLFICNITFLRGFIDKYKFSGVGTGWSLTVEEMFYLFSPVFFYLIKKSKLNLVKLPILLLLCGLGLCYFFTEIYPSLFLNSYLFILDFTFFGRSFEFFVGIMLALFVFKNPIKNNNAKVFTYVGLFTLCFFVCLLIILKDFSWNKDRFWSIMTNNYLIPIFSLALLFYGLLYEKTLFRKLLETKLFQILGKSSYVFYLIHTGFVYLLLNDYITNRFIQFVVLNVISIFIFQYFEKPMNIFIRRRFS